MKSWKTTVGGLLIAAGSFLQTIDTPSWMPVLGISLVGIGGLIAGTSARDNDKTSEDVKAK